MAEKNAEATAGIPCKLWTPHVSKYCEIVFNDSKKSKGIKWKCFQYMHAYVCTRSDDYMKSHSLYLNIKIYFSFDGKIQGKGCFSKRNKFLKLQF